MRVEIKQFTGGITDFVQTDDVTACELAENLLITKDSNLVSRDGSRVIDGTGKPTTVVNEAQAIYELNDWRIYVYATEFLAHHDSKGWVKIIGVTDEHLLTKGVATSSQSAFYWNDHLIVSDDSESLAVKIYEDSNGDLKAVTAGLPSMATPTVTPTTNDAQSFIYTFHYSYEYQAQESTFLDYGPTTTLHASNASLTQNDITNIPVLVNGADDNYDTANIKVKIFRTVHEGQTGYLVGEVANGTTTFTDNFSDDTIQSNEVLYTANDVKDNHQPPNAKYSDINAGVAFYANTKEFPYRVWQAQLNDVDSVPNDFYTDFEEEVKGLSSFQSNEIVFTRNQLHRIEGILDYTGAGIQRPVLVADKVGCLNNNSIVKTDKGVFFAGPDSFYWTNGYEEKKIPAENKNLYRRYTEIAAYPEAIQGSYDRINQRVFWTTRRGPTSYEIFVYDMTFNAFTTWKGESGSFDTTSILVTKEGNLIRGDRSGYIFKHEEGIYGDPLVDLTKQPSQWQEHPVIYKWKHIDFDFGVSDLNKFCRRVALSGDGRTSLDLAVRSYNNSYDTYKELKELQFRSGIVWGDDNWVWGDDSNLWGIEIRLNKSRRFPSRALRCKTKQLELTNAYTTLAESLITDDNQRVTINTALKTATLLDPNTYWPDDLVNKDLVINGTAYKITQASSDICVLENVSGLSDGSYHWAVKGYAHNQQFHLSSVIFDYEMLDESGGYYQRGISAS